MASTAVKTSPLTIACRHRLTPGVQEDLDVLWVRETLPDELVRGGFCGGFLSACADDGVVRLG